MWVGLPWCCTESIELFEVHTAGSLMWSWQKAGSEGLKASSSESQHSQGELSQNLAELSSSFGLAF